MNTRQNLAAGAGMVLILAACGGGGSSESGTSGTTSAGTIEAFGSIVVNGNRYGVERARIRQDGRALRKDDLALGMRVVVRDDDDDDDAERVELDEAVRGPVDDVDPSSDLLVVMGQTVRVGAGTRYDDPLGGLGDIAVGDVVEVMGLREADGTIAADYIEGKGGDARPYTVTGPLRNLDRDALLFEVGGLTVDYQAAEIDDDEDDRGVLREGALVEVKDADRTYVAGSGQLVATKVELAEGAQRFGERRWIEIERIVTAVNGDGTFVVGGEVTVDPSGAVFRRGTSADIVVGVRLEIEGVLDADGVLQAREIEFEDREVDIEAPVEAIDTAAGTLTLLGIEVTTDRWTEYDDLSGLGALAVGDFVEVEGHVIPGGGVVAREIEREDDTDEIELKGPISAFDAAAGTVTVVGRTLVTDAGTSFDDTGRERFFERLIANVSVVEAEWAAAGFEGAETTPVDELELEDDGDDEDDEDDETDEGDDDGDHDDADDDDDDD